ncbi:MULTISPECIES: PTS galactitol transporter subunit IIC [Lactobacillus]|uniref:PTS galactitol transporter subunit IIC n=1 Tax=Lactobacillus TaxID=1578 RepID=UPI001C6A5290|nr:MULTISPECIES: PTS transporter subunit IIC [Lactobacillus]MCX8720365.1 PTS sugar transporter subunit IIC [Lactobacillus sp. B4010]MCX8723531.1 PTS sugar transporter subunit IIC [Lactobacillus sp. B4005]MCX8732816.1 PTS sugar transporter subunit IIC [Lactobacillus sp. B4015]MCX8735131.1 PTS sugar transporter subunit IIC [Lactobacillus sp. B4012]QYN57334.1 PTS sugar transporter subunit IIC [Lactobacillus panisapium]
MKPVIDFIMYIVGLGPTVLIPIIMLIFGLCVRVPFTKALRGGLMVGIGFIGLNATVSILTDVMNPAIKNMIQVMHLNLQVIDVGWPSASAIAYGTAVGVSMIPLGIAINILMLVTKTTSTIDVDIWDFWHFAFSGSLVYALTKDIVLSLFLASVNMIVIMVTADRTAPLSEKYLGLPGISIPHGYAGSFVPIAVVFNWLIDKIPGINKIHMDAKDFNKKFGSWGEPTLLGFAIGIIIGILAYGFIPGMSIATKLGKIMLMGVTLSAVMIITPKMAALLLQGVVPVSDAIQSFTQKKFAGKRKIYIGMDTAVGIGSPVVLACATLMIPVALLFAFILPGNQFLPTIGLVGFVFMFPLIVSITHGDFFRSFIIGAINVIIGLWIGTNLAPLITKCARAAHFAIPKGSSLISSIDYGSNPYPWLIVQIAPYKIAAYAIGIVLIVGLCWWNRKKITAEEKVAAAANQDKK